MPSASNCVVLFAGGESHVKAPGRALEAYAFGTPLISVFAHDFITQEFSRLTRHAIANSTRAAAKLACERAFMADEFDRLTRAAIANGRKRPIFNDVALDQAA
ncbi:MAG TPA: hypothetical protein VHT51_18895 [Micropepsaceae bacterium]|jgi:hypothetical protein|nr:hypothetical protein [Micropepsaceae bacterium]